MPIFVFLDTNNWIYLANGFNVLSNEHDDLHYKVFDTIEKRVDDGSLVFLINDIILEEFERNKARTEDKIADIQNKSTAYNGTLKAVQKFLPDETEKVKELREKLKAVAEEKVNAQRAHIARVEAFLKTKTKRIDITPANKVEASDMAVAKKAPFVGDKSNSTADALLILSSVEHLSMNEKKRIPGFETDDEIVFYPESYFVSSNSGDFSDPEDRNKVHPDLKPILERSKTKFYYSLNPLVKSLEDKILTLEEEALIDDADHSWHCGVCEFEFSRVDFTGVQEVFNPYLLHRDTNDPNQLPLFDGMEIEHKNPVVQMRTAECDHCGAEFIECVDCGELFYAAGYDINLECPGCNYKYKIVADRDRKGIIYDSHYEIVQEHQCLYCGDNVDEVNEEGICDTCLEYRNKAETD